MKFYTGIPFLGLWKKIWVLLQRLYVHRMAAIVAVLCLCIGSFMGLSRGFMIGFQQSQATGATLGIVSGYTILDRIGRGEMVQVERMASTLLDLSVMEFYQNRGLPITPWFIQLQYQLRGWGSMSQDTTAYVSMIKRVAEYRNTHPSDYLRGQKKVNSWLMSYLPPESIDEAKLDSISNHGEGEE